MKKLGILLAAALLVAAFAACGEKNKDDGLNGPLSSSSTASSEAPADSGDAADDPSPSDSGAGADTGDVPEGDSLVDTIQDEKLKAAYQAAMEEFGDRWLSMPGTIMPEQLNEIYYVDADDVEEFAGEMSMVNVSGDTFVAVKAKPGRADAVAQALDRRRQDIISQFETYPVNFMDVKSQAAKVITEGDYVFLVLIGDLNVPDGEDATLEMAEAEVERAENAIRSVFVG